MVLVNMEALLGTGFRFKIFSVGASVALKCRGQYESSLSTTSRTAQRTEVETNRARAANVSMIKLSHNSCTALRTLWLDSFDTADTKVMTTAVILTVI